MLATLGPPPTGAGWAWEWKWDGVRAIVTLDRGTVRLMSRNDKDMTDSYPDLAGIAPRGLRAVLDGEIVALDRHHAPDFALLQNRMHVVRPTAELVAAVPVRIYLFDLLWDDGRDLTGDPYSVRRAALEAVEVREPAEIPPVFTGDVEPGDLLNAAGDKGLEGVVAKRVGSPYRPGRRSPDWIKVPLARTQEVVIVGWKPGGGRRTGMIGSLVLGLPDDEGSLVYCGNVGTGFTEAMLRQLAEQLAPLARDSTPLTGPVPREEARTARWVEPVLVAEVQYRTWTPDGRLRHPSYRGLRPDRRPDDITSTVDG